MAALRAGLVHRHLFEAGDQVGCAVQVAGGDVGGLVYAVEQAVQRAAAQASLHGRTELAHFVGERADCHQAVAQWGVELVGHTGHQPAQSGHFFGPHQLGLGGAKMGHRTRQIFVGSSQCLGAALHPGFELGIEFAQLVADALDVGHFHRRPHHQERGAYLRLPPV